MITHYNLKNIRALLLEGFAEEDLRRLCYDTPELRPVYDQLPNNSSKAEVVDRLIKYAHQTLKFETLLNLAKEQNPDRFELHQPYDKKEINGSIPPVSGILGELSLWGYNGPQKLDTKNGKKCPIIKG